MARTARIKQTGVGVAHYHIISRANDKRFLFQESAVKNDFVDAMLRVAAFSGVVIEAYAVMSNHFHIVVRVTRSNEIVPEEEVLRRVGILKGEKARQKLAAKWDTLRTAGANDVVEKELERLRARMNEISEMVKTLKETFDRMYRLRHNHYGTIWSGRFTSTLIESGSYLSRCLKYVFFNPVRAGIVSQAKNYAWCWCMGEKLKDMVSNRGDEALASSENMATEVLAPIDFMNAQTGGTAHEWWMKRIFQMSNGKVFGSALFVMNVVSQLGHLFSARRMKPHSVSELGFSTHGWRLAATTKTQLSAC